MDDINQPFSCAQWGNAGNDNIPTIIDDGSTNTVFNWFENPNGTNIYPLIVFIDHTMTIDRILGTNPLPELANIIIENLIENISENEIEGCTDPNALNYNPDATEDDGSCEYITSGDIIITEIFYKSNGSVFEYIEIYNTTSTDIELQNWQIAIDNYSQTISSSFPLSSQGFGVITGLNGRFTDVNGVNYLPANDPNWFGYTHNDLPGNYHWLSFQIPDNYGVIKIIDNQGSLIDSVMYSQEDGFPTGNEYAGKSMEFAYLPQTDSADSLNNIGEYWQASTNYDYSGIMWNKNGVLEAGSPNSWNNDYIFGCTDPSASNYNEEATIDDGSCVYNDIDATLSFGEVNLSTQTIEILLENSAPVSGFQFEVDSTITITDISGGMAEELGFMVDFSENNNVVLGFSADGAEIPSGIGVLSILNFDGYNDATVCLSEGIFVSGYENPQYFSIEYGDCITLDYLKGDVNLDEVLNILDVVTIVNIIFENINPYEYELWASDYNGDDEINIMDIVQIVNCIMTGCWEGDTSNAQASINMEMSEDLKLTISIDNFSSSNYMNLVIDFDDNLSFQNYSLGDGISLFFESVFNNEIYLAFESLPMNSFELINIQFEAESNYENAMIHLSQITILDNNGNFIYHSCSNPIYTTLDTCIENGGSWNINSDELFVENYLCYELVNDTYIWTNSCFY